MEIYGRGSWCWTRTAVERDDVENLSTPGRDLRILALTVVPTVTGRGAF